MTPPERRAVSALALIFSIRMLGLFMILPVFSLAAESYPGATPFLIGLALGVYGITQAILQIPFGMLSDKLGRIPVISLGLLLLMAGSVMAALADSIETLILARAIQGAGAIGAVVMALTADLTREEQRTKAMALIGMSIGLSFGVAMVIGPLISSEVSAGSGAGAGISNIFWLTAVLASIGLLVLLLWVPKPTSSHVHREAQTIPAQLGEILRNRQLLRLDLGIFMLHCILTSGFLVFPSLIQTQLELPVAMHWQVYLPVLVLSIVLMLPFMKWSEQPGKLKPVFLGAISIIGIAQLLLWQFSASAVGLLLGLLIFFTGFNLLEATLPSLVSRVAPADKKGTAIGVYSSAQFTGIFVGGVLGGTLLSIWGHTGVFAGAAGLAGLWLILAASMKSPQGSRGKLLRVGHMSDSQARLLATRIAEVPGVIEAVVVGQEGVAYLKVDRTVLEEDKLSEFIPVQG